MVAFQPGQHKVSSPVWARLFRRCKRETSGQRGDGSGGSLDIFMRYAKDGLAEMQPKLAFLPESQRGGPGFLEQVFEDGANGRG